MDRTSSGTTGRHRARRRAVALTIATALTAGLIGAIPQPAHAAGNSLYFRDGSDHKTFGANSPIYIDGTITFDDQCWGGPRKGIDDFFYPATDVYIVPAGSASDGSGLTDAGGFGPNTIIGTGGGAFLDELIAVVTPTGSLGEGEFDVVFDTCQDGIVDFEDEIFYEAITVDIPDGQLPPVNASIRQLKDRAREEYATWLTMHMGMSALFALDKAKEIATCLFAPNPDCMTMVLIHLLDLNKFTGKAEAHLQDQVLNLMANQAKNYGAIWQDPPDADFDQPTTLRPVTRVHPAAGAGPVAEAMAGLLEPLAQEAALSEALLHALERYQGAQAEGDEEWALVQARAVRDLSEDLSTHLQKNSELQQLRDAVASNITAIEATATTGAALINRVRTSGFTPDERRTLRNRGFSAGDIADWEGEFVAQGRAVAPSGAKVLAEIDAVLAARAGMKSALDGSAAGWAAQVTDLESRVEEKAPDADAGGPYASAGRTVTLDASATTTPSGSTVASYEWDVDGDGDFDDATGVTPSVTLPHGRSHTVGVRVTNNLGGKAVDYAKVTVAGGDKPPVVSAATPARATTVVVGTPQTFTVTAADPDGDALSYEWFVGGTKVAGANGPSYTYDPAATAVGERIVRASVKGAGPRVTSYLWGVSVVDVDKDTDGWTKGADCDDNRADVHPGGFERIGNGVDDDCDAGTPDGPVGGITGKVFTWGEPQGLGTNSFSTAYSPVPLTSLGDAVVQIESSFRLGYAVLSSGGVRSWGLGYDGALGNNTAGGTARTPVVVQNVGGGGELGNVVEVASDETHVLARRADGTVVSWGSNLNQQLGDGSLVNEKLTPVETVNTDGSKLAGVSQVEAGESTSFAVNAADGKVKVWGVNHCDGDGANVTRRNTATVNPLFGSGVVQIASGDSGGAILRKANGSAWSCSSYTPLLGRGEKYGTLNDALTPKPIPGLSKGVIDVAHGSSSMLALTEDGSVWTWGKNLNHTLDIIGLGHEQIQWTPKKIDLPAGPPIVDVEIDYSSTAFATRADGSVIVWGANNSGSGGVGDSAYKIVGAPTIDLKGNRAIAVAGSAWNGLALVRPADDPAAERPQHWVKASVADTEIGEASGGTFTVTLSEPARSDVDVAWSLADTASGTATVVKGASSVAIPVKVKDDELDEDDEDVAFHVTSVSDGLQLARSTAVGTVVDDDAAPTVGIKGTKIAEGAWTLTDVPLQVTLSAKSAKDVEVSYATADGSAKAPGDYTTGGGRLFIPAGQTTAVAHVAANGDTEFEDNESFTVSLTDPVNATLGEASAEVTLTDSEPLRIDVVSPTVTEGDTGTTAATFTVSVSPLPAGTTVSVPWSLKAGTAEIPADVEHAAGTLTFEGSTTERTVTVDVVNDDEVEPLPVETFRLVVGKATATDDRPVLVADQSDARIMEDDVAGAPPVVDAGGARSGTEGSPIAIAGTVTDDGTVSTVWSVDEAGCEIADPASLSTTVTCVDEVESATLTLTADDGVNVPVSDTTGLAVGNADPAVRIMSPAEGFEVRVGTSFDLTTQVSDPGVNDDVTCTIDWGDRTADTTGCTGSHSYAVADAYNIEVTARDSDGGVDHTSITVHVKAPAWQFEGFFAPVDNAPIVNVVKAGSTVPVKFGLGGNRGMDIFAPGFPASAKVSCTGGPLDTLEETALPGQATLTYDAASGRYHYNWKTQSSWSGTCRRLVLRLADGTEKTAEFRFK